MHIPIGAIFPTVEERQMPATIIDDRVTDRRPFAGRPDFGQMGAYRRLSRRARFRIDPGTPDETEVTNTPIHSDNKATP